MGVWKGGGAPFLGRRRWKEHKRVQGSIFGCRRWRNHPGVQGSIPRFEPGPTAFLNTPQKTRGLERGGAPSLEGRYPTARPSAHLIQYVFLKFKRVTNKGRRKIK